jgi:elongation factor Ts
MDIEQLKTLRQETGVSFAECKKALEEANGDLQRAKEILKQRGQKIAELKTVRTTQQGIIESYVHPNRKVGVLLDLRCESDFVARSVEFQQLAHELVLQIAAMNPLYVKPEDIPEDFLAGERKIYEEQLAGSGKPQKIIDQIVEGKLKKYKEEVSLLSQPWIKDDTKTIQDLLNEYIAKIGENILVKRFVRYQL